MHNQLLNFLINNGWQVKKINNDIPLLILYNNKNEKYFLNINDTELQKKELKYIIQKHFIDDGFSYNELELQIKDIEKKEYEEYKVELELFLNGQSMGNIYTFEETDNKTNICNKVIQNIIKKGIFNF